MGWTKSGNPQDIPNRALNDLHKRAMEAMQAAIDGAVEDYQRFTSTRPSAKSGKEGRVDTGAMLEAVSGKVFEEGISKIVGQFGFLGDQELYYLLQTVTGFEHPGGDMIRPTLALRDAAAAVIVRFAEGLG